MKRVLSLILSVLMVVSVFSFGAVSVAAEDVTLIEKGSDWYYWTDPSIETALPEGWYAADFDVSAWGEPAPAPFGNGYFEGKATDVGNAQPMLFVRDFTVADLSSVIALSMEIMYDQDPVVYINGEKVFETEGYTPGYSFTTINLTSYVSVLKEGTNRIAVYMDNTNADGGFGYGVGFDMALVAASPVDENGYVRIASATKTGFASFGDINAATNILDGNVDSCSGSGRDKNTEQSWTVTFFDYIAVSEIYLQTKGKEDNSGTCVTSHEDGVTFGYYNVYVGDTLVAENVPAISKADGGYTITLDGSNVSDSVRVELTGDWLAGNWANLADITVKGEVAEITGPETIEIGKYGTGWENWSGATYLYIMAPGGLKDYTWTIDISDGAYSEGTVTMKPNSIYDFGSSTLYRFAVCNNTYDNSFFPNVGVDYRVKVSIADGSLEKYVSEWTPGYVNNDAPIAGALNVTTHFGVIENWSGKTYFIVGATPATGASQALYDDLASKDLTLKVVLKDETAGKTYVIPEYAFDVPGDEFYADWFLRLAFCDYGIVPVSDHQYTITLSIIDGDKVIYEGTSAEGLYTGGNDAFKNDGAIIPEDIPHSYVDLDVAFEGYQLGTDGSSVRFIGSVNDIAFENVDLKITVINYPVEKFFSNPTASVYKTLNSAEGAAVTVEGSGVEAPMTVDAEYLFGYAVTGIPAGTYTFNIVPTATTASGLVVTGEAASVTVTIG